jgi:DNA polymerase-3 subunit beta
MAVQDIRYYLNGVLFSVEKDVLRVVATDGHRLSFASQQLEGDHGSVEAILPRKTVLELIKLLSDGDEPVSLAIGSNQARFSFGGIEIVSKIVEGKFPDYQKVIPTTHKNRVSLERATLAQSLNRAAILSNEKIRGVRLVFTKDRAFDHLHQQTNRRRRRKGSRSNTTATRSTSASTSRTCSTS